MSEDHDKTQRFELKTGLFSAAWSGKRMAELVAVFSLAALLVLAYILWDHKEDANRFQDQYLGAMKLLSSNIEENAIAQREFACLLSKDQGVSRSQAFISGECRRQARVGSRSRWED
jgi:hypothetical protein